MVAQQLPAQLGACDEALVVVAHPDDESFGLGGVLLALIRGGIKVRLLCLTAGEASTVGAGPELPIRRREELQQAARQLGLDSAELLGMPDGGLSRVPMADLERTVDQRLGGCDLMVVFEPGGVTGHPDHRAATAAAENVAFRHGLPCLEWGLAGEVAATLQQQFGVPFTYMERMSRWPLELIVDRAGQRAAISCHLSQDPNNPVLERRLALEENRELVYIRQPPLAQRLSRLTRELDGIAVAAAAPDARVLVLRRLIGLAATISPDSPTPWSRSGAGWQMSALPDLEWSGGLIWGAEAVISGLALIGARGEPARPSLMGAGSGRVLTPGDEPLQAAARGPLRILRLEVGPGS